MRALVRIFISWLPLAITITGLSLLCYISAQQVLRQSMNDMPVEIAEDTSALLARGVDPQSLTTDRIVDIRSSIAPFVIVYDSTGKVISGTGALDGQVPTPPHGVFENVDFWRWGHTWQPDKGVRISAAIIPFTTPTMTGFVLGGRNMHLAEDHILHIGYLIFEAWILMMIATFVAKGFARYFS